MKTYDVDISVNIDDIKEEGYWDIKEHPDTVTLSKEILRIKGGHTKISVYGIINDNILNLQRITISGKGSQLYGDKYIKVIEKILHNAGDKDNALPIGFIGGKAITAIPEIVKAEPEILEKVEKQIDGKGLKDSERLFTDDSNDMVEINITEFLLESTDYQETDEPKDTAESYTIDDIRRHINDQLTAMAPDEVEIRDGLYSVIIDIISTGREDRDQLEVVGEFFGLDYVDTWEEIERKADEVAINLTEQLGLPGHVDFGMMQSNNYCLFYIWKEGDHPEWESREITEKMVLHVTTKEKPYCPDHPRIKMRFIGYGHSIDIDEEQAVRYSVYRCPKDGRTYGDLQEIINAIPRNPQKVDDKEFQEIE